MAEQLKIKAIIPHLKGALVSNGKVLRVMFEIDTGENPGAVALLTQAGKVLSLTIEEEPQDQDPKPYI